ncbi:DeoR/GlpR family DNA-binding transcription regulator [Paenibacillus humicola]|uniref:DeoR/GlpR family DNA-binding transcription regulator n=1 Tax=Paenibacillus humicola TaxID=3110540 RepID=UPI00237AABF3|nr:DeoR/GlpR family DNA-binding transcription regulator [Paenibacillus humicola]
MFAPQRREKIMQLLQQSRQIVVKELSRELGVSEGTLRTDLKIMEEEGLLERTHGGAVPPRVKTSLHEQRIPSRSELNHEEKRAIGRRAAELVKQGQCILLDASSTVLELAKALAERDFLTVVTNGLEAAMELGRNPRINVILIGGVLRPGSGTVEGVLGRSILNEVHADVFFTSAEGFTVLEGMTDFSLHEAELKKAMAANAARVVALLDHTKLGRRSIATSVPAKAVHTLVTDPKADRSLLRGLSSLQVLTADNG